MWDLIDEKLGEKDGRKKGDTIKKYTNELIAQKRTSVPEDVAKLVSFLAGPDSDHVTGQTQLVDGTYTAAAFPLIDANICQAESSSRNHMMRANIVPQVHVQSLPYAVPEQSSSNGDGRTLKIRFHCLSTIFP